MPRTVRISTFPLKMFGLFLISFLILLGGIHQTASLTSKRHEDPTFGPPVVQRALKKYISSEKECVYEQ